MRRSVLVASLFAAAHDVRALTLRTNTPDCGIVPSLRAHNGFPLGSWTDATALATKLVAGLTTAEKVRRVLMVVLRRASHHHLLIR